MLLSGWETIYLSHVRTIPPRTYGPRPLFTNLQDKPPALPTDNSLLEKLMRTSISDLKPAIEQTYYGRPF